MDDRRGAQSGDEGIKQTRSEVQRISTLCFGTKYIVGIWLAFFFLYNFILKPASLLDGGAAINGETLVKRRFTSSVYISIYLHRYVNIDPYADDWFVLLCSSWTTSKKKDEGRLWKCECLCVRSCEIRTGFWAPHKIDWKQTVHLFWKKQYLILRCTM